MNSFKNKKTTKILTSIFVAVIFLFNTLSPALATFPTIPQPYSTLNQWERYQTDLFSGSASYSYPIKVPKGTDDLTPDVSLTYNSSAARDASAYTGMGWELNRDYIERDTNFTPGSTSDDKFKLHFQGSVQDLIYISSEGRYHTKIESHLNITKISSGSSNEYGDYWKVITPDGTMYRFGFASNSEQVCNGRSYVYRYNLDKVTDVHSNEIYYTYSESSGASYLTKIEYNSDKARVINFTYASNPYSHQVYTQGCNISDPNVFALKPNLRLLRAMENYPES